MAFTTTAQTDNVLLRGLNFRYPNNAPVSSFFSLYANGVGQTYWSNAITVANLSTLSTSLALQNSTLSTMINNVSQDLLAVSTNVSSLYGISFSTTLKLLSNDATLSTSVGTLSNQFIFFSNDTSNKFVDINYTIYSTMSNAVADAENLVPVYNTISAVQSSINFAASTLSTTIGVQNTSTYFSLTSNYINYTSNALISTTGSLTRSINTLGTNSLNKSDFSTFSSIVTYQLISSSQSLQSQLTTLSTLTFSSINSIVSKANSTLTSTLLNHERRIVNLESLSTNLSSITNTWISTYTSTATSINNSTLYSYIGQNSNAISSLNNNFSTLNKQVSTVSTFTSVFYQNYKSTITDLTRQISNQTFAYSTLTASSILVSIWSSFYNLEIYTSSMIGVRYESIDVFESTLLYSTSVQNISTSGGYFNYYVSTLYASTLSTLVPSTIAFTSSMVSTLYSTSYTYMISSLNSSMSSIQTSYINTTSTLQAGFVNSTQTQVNSSLVGYITVPAGIQFSSISTQTVRTFSTITGNNATQSTIFYSTQNFYNFVYSSLTASTIATNNLALSSLSTATFLNTTLLSNTSTSFGNQLGTQSTQFLSTILIYNTTLSAYATTAYTYVVNSTINSVNTATSTVTVSTVAAYNAFVAGLSNQAGAIGVSTLYTASTLSLTGSTYTQLMDLTAFRNFYVSISNINNGGSNYRLGYTNLRTGLNYNRGIIHIDINTVGLPYTNFNGQLRFDVNTVGIPTSVWKNVIPYISNADYAAQYEYTILSNTVWTNLLGLYPRVRVSSIMTITNNPLLTVTNTITGSNWSDPSTFLRGTPLTVSWSNYSFFPYAQVGQVPFEPQVMLETYVNNTLFSEYGPYPFSVSTASIVAPYVVGNYGRPDLLGSVRIYVLGYPTQFITSQFTLLQPMFNNISIANGVYGGLRTFIGGYELIAQTDNKNYPLFRTQPTVTGTSNKTHYNDDPTYVPSNLTNNLINRAGYNGSPMASTFSVYVNNTVPTPGFINESSASAGYVDYFMNFSNANILPDLVAVSSLGGGVTFTLNNLRVSTSFYAANFSFLGSNMYEVYNQNLLTTSNVFSNAGDTIYVQYAINLPRYVSSANSVTVNPFAGPFGTAGPSPTVSLEIPDNGLVSRNDSVSTLIFYNVDTTPLSGNLTAGQLIKATIQPTGSVLRYTYNVSTTSMVTSQVFSF